MRLHLIILTLLLLAIPAGAEYIPPNIWQFTDDFYDIYAEPDLSACLMGDPLLERGETTTLMIQVMNHGKILGFEADKTPTDANETQLAATEQQLEAQGTTAIGIITTLSAPADAPIEVKSGPQQMGSLPTGLISQPCQFQVKVKDNARAGTYNLTLRLDYDYQADVAVTGNPSNPDIDYWYKNANITHTIQVKVKDEPYFEVVETTGYLATGEEKLVNIIIKNTGEKPAYDAIARISVVNPLSTTDDQAYLGTLEPGEEATAQFKIKVKSDATPKTHCLNIEIKYTDSDDETHISPILKAPLEIREGESIQEKIKPLVYGASGLIILIGAAQIIRKKWMQ